MIGEGASVGRSSGGGYSGRVDGGSLLFGLSFALIM
jgi:hypothetical protein